MLGWGAESSGSQTPAQALRIAALGRDAGTVPTSGHFESSSRSSAAIGRKRTVKINSDFPKNTSDSCRPMPRATVDIARDIATFIPKEDNWLALDSLLVELWQAGRPEQAIPELLGLFERYPEEDGYGVMWSVLHGLESLPNYEPELLRSLARQPSEFGVRMVGRLLNAGMREVGDVSLLDTLHGLASTAKSPLIRETARTFASRNK